MKTALALALALLLIVALGYGHDASMTDQGFAIQGYIGAAIPALLALLSAAIGAALVRP